MEVGVLDAEHRNRLVGAAKLIPTPLHKMHLPSRSVTVDEWLHLLRLDHYAEQFRKNRYDDMERVGRIWEVELTTVVEIRLVGHLRRILVSLGDGLQQRPSRPCVNGSLQHLRLGVKNQEDLTSLSTDLQIIVSFSQFFVLRILSLRLILTIDWLSRPIWLDWRTKLVRR